MKIEPLACYVDTEQGLMLWPIEDINDAGTYCEPDEFPQLLYTSDQLLEVIEQCAKLCDEWGSVRWAHGAPECAAEIRKLKGELL